MVAVVVENVYLCNECNEMYEDELTKCERIGCDGSTREVEKSELGIY